MKKIVIILLLFLGLFFSSESKASAADCSEIGISTSILPQSFFSGEETSVSVSIDTTYLPDDNYRIATCDNACYLPLVGTETTGFITNNSSTQQLTFNLTSPASLNSDDTILSKTDTRHVYLMRGNRIYDYCKVGTYDIQDINLYCPEPAVVYQQRDLDGDNVPETTCYADGSTGCLEKNTNTTIEISGVLNKGVLKNSGSMWFAIGEGGGGIAFDRYPFPSSPGVFKDTHPYPNSGDYTVTFQHNIVGGKNYRGACNNPKLQFTIRESCPVTECSTNRPQPNSDKTSAFQLCKQIDNNTQQYSDCLSCAGLVDSDKDGDVDDQSVVATGIWTAVGCIPTNATSIVQTLIKIGLSVAGGVALLMILASGFMFSTSQGDSKRTTEAKELLTSAVIGLLFIIFSVTMLQFIGVSVLHIPGFGG